MKWKQFHQIAFPEPMVLAEAKRSIIWKINRWFGLRFGYVFYHLGFSANLLSAMRLILAFLGFYFLSFADSGSAWKPVLGFFIIVWQVNLDFADGAIARLHKKSSDFGEKLDGLGNAASRAAVIILFGYYTESSFWLWLSVFSGFVLSAFWDSTASFVFRQGRLDNIRKLFRLSSSVVFTLIILPSVIVLFSVLGLPLREFSNIITGCYAALAVLWLAICCF